MPKICVEIIAEEEFARQMRVLGSCMTPSLSYDELIKRWLVMGLARDMMKPAIEAVEVVNKLVRIQRK